MSDNTQDFRPMQARYLELEAEVEKLRDQLTQARLCVRIERTSREKAEAEVERLRVRLRTVVTEWQLRCAALANGEKP